jgi:hypothetical protein
MAGAVIPLQPKFIAYIMTDLINPAAVRKHITMAHERAAAAIYGLKHSRPVVLQLCSMAPDDRRFGISAYCVRAHDRGRVD